MKKGLVPALKSLAAICFLTLVTEPAFAETRTFTSPDGRALEAEIVAATPDTVTLKMASGQTIVAPVAKFSTQDQEFIIGWRKQNPASIKYNFTASFTKDKKDSSKSSSNNHTITTETWVCNMKIANRSGQMLEKVKVDYDIYHNQAEQGRAIVRKTSGTTTIESIKNLQELVIPTSPLKLTTSQLEGGFYYADGARSRQKDSIEGLAIKISHEGKPVFNWASGGVPSGRAGTAEGKDSVFGK